MGYRITIDIPMDTPQQHEAFRTAEALAPDDDIRSHLLTIAHTDFLARGHMTGGWEDVAVH
jgi:hypothetical protein